MSSVESNLKTQIGKSTPMNIIITQVRIEKSMSNYQYIKYLFLLILIGTVLIGLFGLIISAYSSIIERSREISIIRTLGLRPNDVNTMFRIENLIILLASGLTGSIIGYIMGYFLSFNISILLNRPFMNSFPWDIAAIIFGFSILVLILGMKFLLRKLSKQNLLEIYRATI
jgi:putative ABC transport system permease protein